MTQPSLGDRMFKTALRVDVIYIAVIVVLAALVWLIF